MMCELCDLYEKRQIKTYLYRENDRVIIVDCQTHPSKPIIVLKRHTAKPAIEELRYMEKLASYLFPHFTFREPRSILDHFHLHAE